LVACHPWEYNIYFQKINYDDVKFHNKINGKGWIHKDRFAQITAIIYLTPNGLGSGTSLYKLKSEGYIRAIGLSIFEPTEGMAAIRNNCVDCIQVVYNILNRLAAKDLFPLAHENNIGVIAREPLNNGILTGKFTGDEIFEEGDIRYRWTSKYFEHLVNFTSNLKDVIKTEDRTLSQTALQFVLSQPSISTVIPGMKTTDQVDENFRTVNLKALTEEELKNIVQYLMHK